MYNETITIFNRLGSRNDSDVWYPHVLHNVCVYRDHAALVASLGENTTDSVSIIIALKNGAASGYPFMQPIAWRNGDDFAGTFTVKSGNEFDFVYCGEWSTEPVRDDEYSDGFFNYMLLNYDSVYAVTSLSDYSRSLLPHLEVLGR